jgi:hypothetical protein
MGQAGCEKSFERLSRPAWPLLFGLVLLAPSCGATSTSRPAQARAIALDWHELTGHPGARMIVDVRRLVVRPNGWSVTASVTNDTRVTMSISRPHHQGKTEFGVLVLGSRKLTNINVAGPGVFAAHVVPRTPLVLRPREIWSGTFSGPGRLSSGRYVRVELGRFTTVGPAQRGVPERFRYITDHVVRVAR